MSYSTRSGENANRCKTCEGIGRIVTLDLDKALDKEKSLNEGAILLPGFKPGNWEWKMYAATGFFDCDKKIKDYSKKEYDKLVYCKPEKINSAIVEGMNSTYAGLVEKFISQYIKTEYEKSEASKKKQPFTTEELTSSLTDIRKLGGGIFCDRRYDTVFVYHNGAESYYAARGFCGLLRV
ncbi:MAG TPA: DUF4256 domain-containing protein [Bacillales bacterium]|nr:DUF4256 domain-containing protein [Bacillales bacterium]